MSATIERHALKSCRGPNSGPRRTFVLERDPRTSAALSPRRCCWPWGSLVFILTIRCDRKVRCPSDMGSARLTDRRRLDAGSGDGWPQGRTVRVRPGPWPDRLVRSRCRGQVSDHGPGLRVAGAQPKVSRRQSWSSFGRTDGERVERAVTIRDSHGAAGDGASNGRRPPTLQPCVGCRDGVGRRSRRHTRPHDEWVDRRLTARERWPPAVTTDRADPACRADRPRRRSADGPRRPAGSRQSPERPPRRRSRHGRTIRSSGGSARGPP